MRDSYTNDSNRWKFTLPTVGDTELGQSLVSVSAECGYEKYAITLPIRAWQRISGGERFVIKRLVSVGDNIVPCEWHFNRYQRGNLFIDWGHGDLRFWIRMEDTEVRLGRQELSWPKDYSASDKAVPTRLFWRRIGSCCWQMVASLINGANKTG